jgi:bacteriocin biosynthesis cyclodehydratase domain-containing protein
MKSTVLTLASSTRLHAVSVGAFGLAVIGYLIDALPGTRALDLIEVNHFDESAWPEADVEVLASAQPVPDLCMKLDELCHRRTRALVPLVMESANLCLGPVIVPGSGGCWKCWQKRADQHAQFPTERTALRRFYGKTNEGPPGFLEPVAMLGALQIARVVESPEALLEASGSIWQFDAFSGSVSTGRLIGVDGCSQCGSGRDLSDRAYAQLAEALGFKWTPDAGERGVGAQ